MVRLPLAAALLLLVVAPQRSAGQAGPNLSEYSEIFHGPCALANHACLAWLSR